jgi:hypothetical protein
MKKWMKMVGLLAVFSFPIVVQAGDYTYTTNTDNTITITKYTGSAAEVIIPDDFNGKNVTKIAYDAFYYSTNLRNIKIPASITNIADNFIGCGNFTAFTVNASNSVYSSLDGLLYNKSGTRFIKCPRGRAGNVIIPNGVTSISDNAFYLCSYLTNVTISSGVTNIGSSAFTACSELTTIKIPNSVTSIGYDAFGQCYGLVAITVDESNSVYSSLDGVLFNKNRTMLVLCPPGKAGNYAIPAGVTSIGKSAFIYNILLTDVVVPNSVTYIAYMAFFGCNRLGGIYFQGNAPGFGSDAFLGSSAKVYYLPGTTGWTSTYDGRPTVMATTTSTVTLSCNPTAGGTASGGGVKTFGTLATVTATANSGFRFVTWTENGTAVSTSKSYVFLAVTNRTLVANFSALVFKIPGQGISTLGYSPSGTLCQILQDESSGLLCYREREIGGSVKTEVLDFGGAEPMLLFDPQGRPNIVDYGVWRRKTGDAWELVENVSVPNDINPLSGKFVNYAGYLPDWLDCPLYGLWSAVAAAFAPDGSLRILVCGKPSSQEPYDTKLYLGSNAGDGAWRWITIDTFQSKSEYLDPYLAPRYFNFKVDQNGVSHVLYTPEFYISYENYPNNKYRSELRYVSDITGTWKREIVSAPLDDSAEAAWGGSLAVDSTGNVAVASFYVERASTGSAGYANLLYHRRQANGTWTREAIVTSPDGYSAGDGAKFTGAYPYLIFDRQNHPHIVFCDYAAQHWAIWHQRGYSGQIRYAHHDGTRWTVKTLYRQTNPLQNEMRFPIVAVKNGELSFAGMRRTTTTDGSGAILSFLDDYVEGRIGVSFTPVVEIVVSAGGGRVSPSGAVAASMGGSLTLTATPAAGYKFKHWLVNGEIRNAGQEALTITNITVDTTVSVVFERIKAMPWLNLLLE